MLNNQALITSIIVLSSKSSFSERNVSLKHVLQHIEATPAVTQYGLCGMRKWSSRRSTGQFREPFSHCHLHDFVLLNVDLTQTVQFNQNRCMHVYRKRQTSAYDLTSVVDDND